MKAAVYCGTRNLYADMVTAAKSLLHNTDVDKVYFLIEDDIFTHELPPQIETINVSDQTYFSKDSPNYNKWGFEFHEPKTDKGKRKLAKGDYCVRMSAA